MSDSASPGRNRTRGWSGPAILVTAAFIGPGTVVTASQAGAQYGCGLLWTVLLATTGAVLLQSVAGRLGIVSGMGLSESLRTGLAQSVWLRPTLFLIIVAIGAGNAAYQTGNITGAVIGLSAIFGGRTSVWVVVLSVIATGAILSGRDRWLQNGLLALVLMLSVAFMVTACLAMPSWDRVAKGALIPHVASDNISLVIAMIGTTIVPYNLFLHSSRSAGAWDGLPLAQRLNRSRLDTLASIGLGGFVTAAILVTACGAFFDQGLVLQSPGQMSEQLRPALGPFCTYAFAIGLFGAGMTSAVTAPLATSYAVCGCLGLPTDLCSRGFRSIALAVLAIGSTFAIVFGRSPVASILVAQVANGLLLPIAATLMLVVVQRQSKVTGNPLSKASMTSACTVIVVVAILGGWRVAKALGVA